MGECCNLVGFNTIYSISAAYASAFIPLSIIAALPYISIGAAFSYISNTAAQKCCVLYQSRFYFNDIELMHSRNRAVKKKKKKKKKKNTPK